MSRRRGQPRRGGRAAELLGPSGTPLRREDLPPPGLKRWGSRRKAEVVAGVDAGLISLDEACRRYALSLDEFRTWQRLLREHGLAGLRATRAKKVRPARPGHEASGGATTGARPAE